MNRCRQSAWWLAIVGLACGHLAGCGAPTTDPGGTPEATFGALKLAFQEKDFDALWNLVSEPARARWTASLRHAQTELRKLRQQADQAAGQAKQDALARLSRQEQILEDVLGLPSQRFTQMQPKDLFVLICTRATRDRPKILEDLTQATFLRRDVTGDRAAVTYRRTDGRETTVAMVQTDGVWKIGLPEE